MDTLHYFLTTLFWVTFVIGGSFGLAYLLVNLQDALAAARRGLAEDPYGIDTDHGYDGITSCRLCCGRILTENSFQGICDDCWNAPIPVMLVADAIDYGYENDAIPTSEWTALMRAIEEQDNETEDHR